MRKTYLIICSMLVTACNSPNITHNNRDLTNKSTVIGNIQTNGAPPIAYSSSDTDDEAFEAAAIDADHNDTDKTITLSGTSVQDNLNSYFSRQSPVAALERNSHNLMISHISNPVISLDVDENGSIASTNIYVGSKHYTADNPSESNSRNFFQNFDDPDHGRVIIEVKRNFQEEPDDSSSFNNSYNDELWNFMANYMLNVRWVVGDDRHKSNALRDSDHYYDGYMIAGFETAGANIASSNMNNDGDVIDGEVTFHGNGQGYHTANKYTPSYAGIYFNAIAKVNFATRIVGLETVDTQYCFTYRFEWNCNALSQLNFSSNLSYDAGTNNLSGTIKIDDMQGTIQARFYGTGANAAQELGGTFAIRNGYIRYIGSFGAIRTDVGNIFTVNSAPSVDTSSYDSFEAISEDADANNADTTLIFAGTSVQERIEKFYNRPHQDVVDVEDDDEDDSNNETMVVDIPPSWSEANHLASEDHFIARINNPIISLTFNDEGNIAGTSLYIGDNAYTATLDGTGSATYFSEEFNDLDSGIVSNVTINKNFNDGNNDFDFTAQYMMNIYWNIDERSLPETHTTSLNTERDGYILTGFETVGTAIPTSETAEFSGNGRGYYRGENSSYNIRFTRFDVMAEIDFSTHMIALETTNSSYRSALDFTAMLSYDAGQNNISGTVETDDMKGTIEARFYGTKTDAVDELGGTFAMRNGMSTYYYGYFGAFREHDIEPSFDDVSMIATRGTDRAVEFSSLAVESSITADFTRPEMDAPDSWFYYTKLNDITFENTELDKTDFTNPEITITYDASGLLAEAAVTFNNGTSNQIYRLEDGGNGKSTKILRDGLLVENNAFALGNMEVNRGQEFGFTSKYMVAAKWQLITNTDSNKPIYDPADPAAENPVNQADQNSEATAKLTTGFMIAGFATGDTDSLTSRSLNFTETTMPIEGGATFIGEGLGYYYDAVTLQLVEFDVNATVDFANRTTDIEISETMGYSCNLFNTNCDTATRTALPTLDFSTGDISYTAGENNISKNDLTVDGMTGDINGRFYGPTTEELGGTFHLQDTENDKYYMGYFGTQKQ
ncbi:MAG: transferrin-binding protein-like solute binding protein [Alphaproteobacteria bacterium]|nr:transferrin-binding protein-like solute binding protein [Alphaproteobacteria bacterium]